jgi:HSP20 family protein
MANRDLTPWRMPSMQTFARDPFASFRREMDRLFDDFFAPAEARSFAPSSIQGEAMVMPSIDVHETEKAYSVCAELPGIDPQDLEISLDDNVLTVRGEKRSERREEEGGRRYSERSFGRFERRIPFNVEVDAEHIDANYENGVLKVMLPKTQKAREKSHRIEIKGPAGGPSALGQARTGQTQTAQTEAQQQPRTEGGAPSTADV